MSNTMGLDSIATSTADTFYGIIDDNKCFKKPNIAYLSQSNEDKCLFEKYYDNPIKCGGTFVEIGALDGLLYSNSYFLSMH